MLGVATLSSIGHLEPHPPVTVVAILFRDELPLLRLYARSIARYFEKSHLKHVAIVLNDHKDDVLHRNLNYIIQTDFAALASRVTVHALEELGYSGLTEHQGWRIQQAAKLCYGSICKTSKYIVLDLKNHFIKPVDVSNFVSDDGRSKTYFSQKAGEQLIWLEQTLALFDLNPELREEPFPPAITPWCMESEAARELKRFLEEKHGCSVFEIFMSENSRVSEFLSYACFHLLRDGGWEKSLTAGLNRPATLFSMWPKDKESADKIITRAENGGAEIMSVHRNRFKKLDAEQRKRIAQIWNLRGLFESEQAALRAISSAASGPLEEQIEAFSP